MATCYGHPLWTPLYVPIGKGAYPLCWVRFINKKKIKITPVLVLVLVLVSSELAFSDLAWPHAN